MTTRRGVLIVYFSVMALFFSGCALIQNKVDTELPDELPNTWADGKIIENLPITKHLLDLIKVEQLRVFVQEAIENNPNLAATALRLKATGFMLSEPRSKLLPKVNAEISEGRNNQGINESNGKNRTISTPRLSLDISWEIDIWGRLADEYGASKHDLLAKESEYLLARDALASRVIQAGINWIGLKRSVAIEEERLSVLESIEGILIDRYKNGIGNLDEYSTARSRKEIARADLSGQKTALLRESRRIELLLGRFPSGNIKISTDLPEILSPPVNTPATVLLNRPDIQAALELVESKSLLANAAEKAHLPELRLSGELFRETATLNKIGAATTYWSVLGSLFRPLFEGGRIKAQAQAMRTEYCASLMDLREVVLRALKEVEDGFDFDRDYEVQSQALIIAVEESRKSSIYYAERYRQGLDTIQNLLIAREQEMSIKRRLNEVLTGRLSNRIDLALALGVGLRDDPSSVTGEIR